MRYWMAAAAAVGLVSTAAISAQQGAGEWIAAETKDGVALAFRDDERLRVREVRAIAELPHAAERVTLVACDFTQPLDPDVREARIISGDVAARYTIYLRYAPRFVVVAARDVVIEVQRQQDGCTWSERQEGVAPSAGAVRMPLLRGSWIVESLGQSRSRVTYQIAVNPGGSIPKWLVRRGAAAALPDVIKRLDRCLLSINGESDARCGAQPVARSSHAVFSARTVPTSSRTPVIGTSMPPSARIMKIGPRPRSLTNSSHTRWSSDGEQPKLCCRYSFWSLDSPTPAPAKTRTRPADLISAFTP
jgi:hypothetical protein